MKEVKEFKSFYKDITNGNEGSLCHYTTRLDTFGCGCSHDCKYCYAKSLLDFRGLWHPENPSVVDIDKVRRKIAKIPKDKIIRLGGMTDCFQYYEKAYSVTYNTIKALNEQGIGYLIVTKSDLVADKKYMDIMDKNLAHIQVSITTTDDDLSKTYEKAPLPSQRISAVERLAEQGFDVQVRLSPMIPEYLDMNIINNIKCDKILVEFLRVNSWIRKWFNIDFSDYTLFHKGYNHLPLEKKLEYLSLLKGWKEMSVCDDVPEHYDYFKNNFNHNIEDCCNLALSLKENS